MTVPRFLAFKAEPARLQAFLAGLVPGERASQRLNRELDRPDLVVFTSPETPLVRMQDDQGIIVGRLYSRASCSRVNRLDNAASGAAGATGGKSLLEDNWGNYVSFVCAGGGVTVLRDPSAAVPAYFAMVDGILVYFSDLVVCDDLGIAERQVDEEYLRQWLTFPGLRTHRTGLAGVTELVPGSAHSLRSGGSRMENAWTPWTVMQSRPRLVSFEAAARAVRSTVGKTVAAQLKDREPLALELSGGLDSAIVAAALAKSGILLPAVNFATRSPDGDERDYARAVARHLGLSLTEIEEGSDILDLRPPARTALRPLLSPLLQPLNRTLCAFAREAGVAGLVTGGGGDNLFCYLTTAAPILDAARERGPAGAIEATLNVASVTESNVWKAARFALRKWAARRRRPPWKRDERFIAPGGLAARMDAHPWLDAPRNALPGKLEHVNSILRAHHYMEPEHPTGEAIIHPLINQPLMELCLSIPTWLWIHGGRNRAVARQAFSDRLPAAAINRRTKGRFESMCARGFEENRTRLANLLLEGELARRELILRDQVERYLKGSGPAPDDDYFRLFDLASLELWLRGRVA